MNDFYRTFGRKLRDARNDAGLSQEQLAGRVDLSRTSITNIELGKQQPSLQLAINLAREVKKPLSALTNEDDNATETRPINRAVERSLENYPASNQEWFKSIVSASEDD